MTSEQIEWAEAISAHGMISMPGKKNACTAAAHSSARINGGFRRRQQ